MLLNDQEIKAAVDSFSTDCFIHPKYLAGNQIIQPKTSFARLAGLDTSMPLEGKTQLEINIQGYSLNVEAWVAPSAREPLILGYPWLVEQGTIFDLSSGVLYLGKKERITVRLIDAPVPHQNKEAVDLNEVNQELPTRVLPKFNELLQHFKQLFQQTGQLHQTRTTKHTIELTSKRPFRLAPYRYSKEKRQIIREQIPEMLADGVIEPCVSPYSSPIIIVKKKDGQPRFCVDYRKLNSITVDMVQTIPRITDALKTMGTARIFSTIDLKSGYWQVPMDPSAKQLTAFTTPEGETYQFRVMPFGLKNAPGTFQYFMSQEVLLGYIEKFCVVYLDDIIVYSQTVEEHLQHLTLVFERLTIHGLTCSLPKCHFGKTKLAYLGHDVAEHGNQAQEEHTQVILDLPPPTKKKELRKFLGTCNWLREYLPHFATTTAPLTDLLAGKKLFRWTEEAQRAYEEVKYQMRQPLRLSRPDPALPYILQTDTSDIGVGAVLYQIDANGDKKIISYASAKFNEVQNRYDPNEKQCFAIMWAIKRYRPYLDQQPFTLKTDKHALIWLNRLKNEKEKLSRWALLLEELKFTVEHCPSHKNNELSDALARHPTVDTEKKNNPDQAFLPDYTQNPEKPEIFGIITESFIEQIIEAQQSDPEISKIAATLSEDNEEFRLIEGGVWKRIQDSWKLIVPEEFKPRVLYEYHDSPIAGHPGCDETLRSIQEHYTWKHIRRNVREHVRKCHLCACTKATRPRHQDQLRPHQPRHPWETIAIDLMGPYPRSGRGKRFILVITDLFSRWVEAFAIGSSDTSVILRLLEQEVFPRWGYPRAILSDNGPQFTSKKWMDACEHWKSQLWTTPIYHPRANPTERRNQEIKKGLRLHLQDKKHKDWDLQLPKLFSLRTRRNAATGYTPSQTLLGQNLQRPGEWAFRHLADISEEKTNRVKRIQQHQAKYQQKYASTGNQKPQYQSGDWVYTKNHVLSRKIDGFHAGFAPVWEGPFLITGHLGGDIYQIDRNGRVTKIHGSLLKLTHGFLQPTNTKDVIGATSDTPDLTGKEGADLAKDPPDLTADSNSQIIGQPNLTIDPP